MMVQYLISCFDTVSAAFWHDVYQWGRGGGQTNKKALKEVFLYMYSSPEV